MTNLCNCEKCQKEKEMTSLKDFKKGKKRINSNRDLKKYETFLSKDFNNLLRRSVRLNYSILKSYKDYFNLSILFYILSFLLGLIWGLVIIPKW